MVIVVDIRGSQEYQYFMYETFKRITSQQPDHFFVFISEKTLGQNFSFSRNIVTEVVKQKIPLLTHFKISSVIRKYKPNVLLKSKSGRTSVPQILLVFGNIIAPSTKTIKTIITGSEFLKDQLLEKYNIEEKKIEVIYKGADDSFQPLPSENRINIKERYAGGNEFFLCIVRGQQRDMLNFLKAFSIFKKMQKSGMRLIILSDTQISKHFYEALRLYKFRNEVHVFENTGQQEHVEITGAAYAVIYPGINPDYSCILHALKCDVPVIVSSQNEMHEILGEAALFTKEDDHKNIADKMMLIYKDENLRNTQIEKGKKQVQKYSWDRSAEQLWYTIQKTVN